MSVKKQELIAEFIGSLFLTTAAITPMILFPNILRSELGVAVLADALAVGFVLSVLIEMFGPISYAHFNPLVSLMVAYLRRISFSKAFGYIIAQLLGGLSGLLVSHLMFFHEIPILIEVSSVNRAGGNYLAEIIGTTILLLAILTLDKNKNPRIGWNIGILVGGQLLATSSTMFANPMITIMRTFTYSAAGIRPIDSLAFIMMQSIGLIIALIMWDQINEDGV
jgi:glycerol uptake facilitator-like aquaporin